MFLARLSIAREGYVGSGYGRAADPSKPLRATVEIIGESGKTEIDLPAETSDRIVALIAEELAASARAVAEKMTAQFIAAGPALPALGQ